MIIGTKLMNRINNFITQSYKIYTTPSLKNQYATPVIKPKHDDLIVVSKT